MILTADALPASIRGALEPNLLDVLVAGLNAQATRVAPCLTDQQPGLMAEARLVLVGAIKRCVEAGSGAYQQQTAGPFAVTTDTRQAGGWTLRPSEVDALAALCRPQQPRAAWSLDTAHKSANDDVHPFKIA